MGINKKYKLLIFEPWDAYGNYEVELIKNKDDKFLFQVVDILFFDGNNINFLIGMLRDNSSGDFSEYKNGKYIFNLFHDNLFII